MVSSCVFFQDLKFKRHIGVEGLQCQCPDLKGKAVHSCGNLARFFFLKPNLSSSRSYGQRFNNKPWTKKKTCNQIKQNPTFCWGLDGFCVDDAQVHIPWGLFFTYMDGHFFFAEVFMREDNVNKFGSPNGEELGKNIIGLVDMDPLHI